MWEKSGKLLNGKNTDLKSTILEKSRNHRWHEKYETISWFAIGVVHDLNIFYSEDRA